jgi:hypothetical protein
VVLAFQGIRREVCGYVPQTDSPCTKIINAFTENTKKILLTDFNQETWLLMKKKLGHLSTN